MIYSIRERAIYVAQRRLCGLKVGDGLLFELPRAGDPDRLKLAGELMTIASGYWGHGVALAHVGDTIIEVRRAPVHHHNPRKK